MPRDTPHDQPVDKKHLPVIMKLGGVFIFRKKNRQVQVEEITISLGNLVPENHILRAVDKTINFSFIYEEVEGLYSDKWRLE